jgi:hypothetical protein
LLSPSAADVTRAQWYDIVRRTGANDGQPPLSESDVTRAVRDGAEALDMKAVTLHYLPVQGGAADIIVEPANPVSFADHPVGLTRMLGPLGRNDRAYLLTVVDARTAPLFVLGWMPNVGQGEGIAWQAPGIRSDVIFGQPVLSERPGSAAWLRQAVLGSTS